MTTELEDDLRASGADEAQIAALVGGWSARDDVHLPAAMRPLIRLVLATVGQWRMAGGGMAPLRPVALDLTAVDVAGRWLGITPGPDMLADLQVIEAEALKAMEKEP